MPPGETAVVAREPPTGDTSRPIPSCRGRRGDVHSSDLSRRANIVTNIDPFPGFTTRPEPEASSFRFHQSPTRWGCQFGVLSHET